MVVKQIGMETTSLECRPFLKWVGGKRRLLPEILKRIPGSYRTYHEPFLGGGALFFELQPKSAVLSDSNPDLIAAYKTVRDDCEGLISVLRIMEHSYRARGASHYMEVRAQDPTELDDRHHAARTIYLNKTCFNGVWRVNKAGKFNVPPGVFKIPPTICDEDNLRACSKTLVNVPIFCRNFKESMRCISSGDFAYFDPPYVPLSETSNFTSYAKDGFGLQDQSDLAKLALEAKRSGVHILLSNSACPIVRTLYADPSFKIVKVNMRRNVNCDAGKRSPVREYLIW